MSTGKKHLITIVGPTAVGKTKLCIKVAQLLNTEIVNADSRQIYKELSIGTAKPSAEELKMIPHYFINHISIKDHYTAGIFEKEATDKLNECFTQKDQMVLSGGSGLFVMAVLDGFDEMPNIPNEIRDVVDREIKEKGINELLNELKNKDPKYYKLIDKNNGRRISRAIAHIRFTNETFSKYRVNKAKSKSFKNIGIILERDRSELYQRINLRVDRMLMAGLVNEVENLVPYKDLRALQTLGYKEMFAYLEGEINMKTAVEKIKQNSRRYAKRQISWNRKLKDWKKFHPDNVKEIINYIDQELSK